MNEQTDEKNKEKKTYTQQQQQQRRQEGRQEKNPIYIEYDLNALRFVSVLFDIDWAGWLSG